MRSFKKGGGGKETQETGNGKKSSFISAYIFVLLFSIHSGSISKMKCSHNNVLPFWKETMSFFNEKKNLSVAFKLYSIT